jgi:hypothetical protein
LDTEHNVEADQRETVACDVEGLVIDGDVKLGVDTAAGDTVTVSHLNRQLRPRIDGDVESSCRRFLDEGVSRAHVDQSHQARVVDEDVERHGVADINAGESVEGDAQVIYGLTLHVVVHL